MKKIENIKRGNEYIGAKEKQKPKRTDDDVRMFELIIRVCRD